MPLTESLCFTLASEADLNIGIIEIYKLLEGDDEAQLTIMAIADGKKGKELRDELGIDQARSTTS